MTTLEEIHRRESLFNVTCAHAVLAYEQARCHGVCEPLILLCDLTDRRARELALLAGPPRRSLPTLGESQPPDGILALLQVVELDDASTLLQEAGLHEIADGLEAIGETPSGWFVFIVASLDGALSGLVPVNSGYWCPADSN
jgi:hypothetical protein